MQNSLYSWAMCRPLPVGKFKWVNVRNKNRFMNRMLREGKYNILLNVT